MRGKRWLGAVLAVGLVLWAAAEGRAAKANKAGCAYDVRGTADPGLNSLTGLPPYDPTPDQTYKLEGTVTCNGSAAGTPLPRQPGVMTLTGRDGSDLTRFPHTSCAFADLKFDLA